MKKFMIGLVAVLATASLSLPTANAATNFTITELSVFDAGSGAGGAEISSYHKTSQQVYVTNGIENRIDVVSISDPENPTLVRSVSMAPYGDGITSVAAGKYVIAVAVTKRATYAADGTPSLHNGRLVVMYPSGAIINDIDLGSAQPDSVTFTPDGMTALVAMEGEPICALDNFATTVDESLDYKFAADPLGGVAVVDLSNPRSAVSKLAQFSGFRTSDFRKAGLVISKTSTSAKFDFEPEFVSAASNDVAYVTIQEANGIAQLDVKNAKFTRIFSAGTTDLSETAFDLSDKDKGVGPQKFNNAYALAMPDAIAAYTSGGDNYFVTANEGDDRADWSCFAAIDDARVKDLEVDTSVITDWETIKADDKLGRAKVNPNIGDSNGDGLYEKIFLLSNRSFSIYKNNKRIYDSKDLIEQLQIEKFGLDNINGQWDTETGEYLPQNRADDKGAEAEGVAVGMVGDRRVAVIGMERMSALLFVDITTPTAPTVISWEQVLPLETVDPKQSGLMWSPEGIYFIDAADSPNGKPLVITSYEVSGTVSIHQIEK